MTEPATGPQFLPPRTCPLHDSETLSTSEPGPVVQVTLRSGQQVWVASRHRDIRAMVTDPRFSANRIHPNVPSPYGRRLRQDNPRLSIISMDEPEHGPARRAVVPEFTHKRLAKLAPRIQQIVNEHIDAMLAGPRPADLVVALALPVTSLVICELLGVPYEDHDFFQTRTQKQVSRTISMDEARAARKDLESYMDDLVRRKEEDPGDDLIGRQIRQQRAQGEVDHEELVALALLLLVAGHETTANMISLGTVALLEHPEQLAKLRADSSKTPAAVEELLRYFSVAEFAASRVAAADTEVGGVRVRAGEGVLALNLAANRDPDVFPDPDRLDIERGSRNHLAFGYGPHQCLGQHLARLELQIVFDTLFARIPTLRLAVPAAELPVKADAAVYGLHKVPVTW